MLRLPRISTRTATRLPFTTLFRSRTGVRRRGVQAQSRRRLGDADGERRHAGSEDQRDPPTDRIHAAGADREPLHDPGPQPRRPQFDLGGGGDRRRDVEGKRVSVRVAIGGHSIVETDNNTTQITDSMYKQTLTVES